MSEFSLRWVLGQVTLPVQVVMAATLWAIASKRRIAGMRVGLLSFDAASEERASQLLEAALVLIGRYHPRLHARFAEYFRCIVVAPTRSAALFWAPIQVCVLSTGMMSSAEPSQVASMLVHEACHARLRLQGIAPGGQRISRRRVESTCVKAQIAFARRLPGSAEMLRNLEDRLAALAALSVR